MSGPNSPKSLPISSAGETSKGVLIYNIMCECVHTYLLINNSVDLLNVHACRSLALKTTVDPSALHCLVGFIMLMVVI